jgi:hypothetical protein
MIRDNVLLPTSCHPQMALKMQPAIYANGRQPDILPALCRQVPHSMVKRKQIEHLPDWTTPSFLIIILSIPSLSLSSPIESPHDVLPLPDPSRYPRPPSLSACFLSNPLPRLLLRIGPEVSWLASQHSTRSPRGRRGPRRGRAGDEA